VLGLRGWSVGVTSAAAPEFAGEAHLRITLAREGDELEWVGPRSKIAEGAQALKVAAESV